MALGVLLPRIRVEELLHLSHATVRLSAEAQLNFDQRLKARVQVGHAQVDELRQFGEELLVQLLVGRFRDLGFALGARELGWVLVWFLDEFLHAGPRGVVVEEFVIALFDACLCGKWLVSYEDRCIWCLRRVLRSLSGRGSAACRMILQASCQWCHRRRLTLVYVRKVVAETGYWFQDCLSVEKREDVRLVDLHGDDIFPAIPVGTV